MPRVVVDIEGVLGDVVALALEGAEPRWDVTRAPRSDGCDLVILDESMSLERRLSSAERSGAPSLVLGVDVTKPIRAQQLRRVALERRRCEDQAGAGLVAVDPPLLQALRTIDLAAKRGGCVLITGPTGVGKEALAKRVHERSGRRGAFVAVNCAALSEGLIESTLFGHVRGAFTGAFGDAEGVFAAAGGGTLFLDEIGELELRAQAKLLRVLEENSVRPVGSVRSIPVDVRLVAATNRDLRREAEAGLFRADLYYRLANCVLAIPELRARPRDLAALIERFTGKHDRAHEVRLSPAARERLLRYSWPGNVRELRNFIDRLMMLCEPGEVSERELCTILPDLCEEQPAPPQETQRSLAALKEAHIEATLEASRGCVKEAAASLGIHRTTLWRRMKRGTVKEA